MTCAKPRLKKPARTLLWVLLDVLLVNAALFLAQVVRYSSNISYSFFENSIRLAPAMTVIFLVVFYLMGMYRTMWHTPPQATCCASPWPRWPPRC